MASSKTLAISAVVFLGCISLFSCKSTKNEGNEIATETLESQDKHSSINIGSRFLITSSKDTIYINSVKGHKEEDTIIGNFTGSRIDTLYVERVVNCNCSLNKVYDEDEHLDHEMNDELVKYYLASSNPALEKVELLGYASLAPRLVNEGDLDGNGTCEVGYLPVWRLSQWRIYHLLTFKDGKWKYLINPYTPLNDEDDEVLLFDTGNFIRESGCEIATPSSKKGLVRIKYQTQGVELLIKDTLVAPDYIEIY